MKPQTPKVTVSEPRLAQLHSVRDQLGARSISDTIGALIRIAAEAGRVRHAIPGVEIRRATDGACLTLDDKLAAALTFDGVRALAAAVRTVQRDRGAVADIKHDFIVRGAKAGGVTVAFMTRGVERHFSPDWIGDFVHVLDRVAAPH